MITLNKIIEKLKISGLEYLHPSEAFYTLAVHNRHGADLGNPFIINILTANEYDNSHEDLSGACFFIGTPAKRSLPQAGETVVFPAFVDAEELLKSCTHIISEYERFCAYRTKLKLLVENHYDFQTLFFTFAGFYDNPVCFGDSGGSVLFYANLREEFDGYDESMRYWVSHGHVPYEYSRKNGNTEGAARVSSSPVPVIMDTGYASKFRRMSYRTCKLQNSYNNYFCVVEAHHHYLPFDRDALIYTADLVTEHFSAEFLDHLETPRNHVLRALLTEGIPDEDTLRDRMQRCHITSSPYYLVLIIGIRTPASPAAPQPDNGKLIYFRNMIKNSDPLTLQIIRNHELILLMQAQEPAAFENRIRSLISYLKEEPSLYIGCCQPYCSIMDTSAKYEEASLACKAGSELFPDLAVYSFSDLYLPVVLSLADRQSDFGKFLVNGVLKLYTADLQKNTEYFQTLFEFLECNQNILECAKKLHIHRNTAIYRLNKAKQAVDVDFDSFRDIVKLYLSMQYILYLMPHGEAENEKSGR